MPGPKPDGLSPREPTRKRRRRRRLLFVAILLGLPLLYLLEERLRGEWLLAACKEDLADRGEKLTVAELTPPLPEGTNVRVLTVAQVRTMVDVPKTSLTGFPSPLREPPAGTLPVYSRGDRWKASDGAVYTWDDYLDRAAFIRAKLPELRRQLTKGVVHIRWDYTAADRGGLWARSASFALQQAALHALHAGDLREALDNLHASARLDGLTSDSQGFIEQLIRIAEFLIAKATVWQALQAEGWADEQLAHLQRDWEDKEFIPAMIAALRMERAVTLTLFPGGDRFDPRVWNSNSGAGSSGYLQSLRGIPWLKGVVDQLQPALAFAGILQWALVWSAEDQRRYVLGVQELLGLAGNAWEHTALAPVCDFNLNRTNLAGKPLVLSTVVSSRRIRVRRFGSDLSLGGLANIFLGPARADTSTRMMITAIALKRYELRHGTSPETLAALVPELLETVPVDLMDGQPLRYQRREEGGFLLYSVGCDGIDQGGDPTWAERGDRGGREPRDLVWPSPAPQEPPPPNANIQTPP